MAGNESQLTDWISQLDSSDGEIRQSARHQLVQTGSDAVPALVNALDHASETMRWEAAKALGEIRDPAAVEPLIEILADDDSVRFVAASALIGMSNDSVPHLLRALIHEPARFRDGGCFVLHHLASDDEKLREPLTPVVEALMSLDSSLLVPVESEKALSKLKQPVRFINSRTFISEGLPVKCSFCRKKRSEQDLLTPRMQILATVCFLFFLTAKPGQANDPNPFLPAGVEDRGWPDVRGADFDAHSPEINLADSWPEEGPPVLWVKELGQGYSAFVAQGNHVYTQAQTLQGQYVYCLEAKTGIKIWQYRYDWPYELAGVYPGPRATPTLAAGKVLFAAPSGLIGCLDADDGKLIWSRNVLEEFHGSGGDGFGYACSPTVVDQLVILPVGGPDASLVALNLNDGKTVWQAGNRPASYCPAFPIEHKGQKLVVGYLENALVIHDLQTGELLLEHELSEGYDEHSAWPLYREPYLWLAAPFRSGSQLLELPDQFPHSEPLKTVWRSRVMSNDVLSSALVDGRIYGFDIFDQQSKTQRPSRGKFRCIDFLTGEELWEQGSGRPERSNNDISDELGQSGIIVADGKLILLNERGKLILLRQNPEQCDILARCSILSGELTWTPPVLHCGCVFIRNQSRAACVYIGNPDLLPTDQATLNLADIPQEAYYDWAGQILSVEPEYAFDLPSTEWLISWYCWSLGLLIVSLMLAAVPLWWIPAQHRRRVWIRSYRIMAFLAGALGTTWISLWYQDFIFTWPLCLYIATEPVLESVQFRREGQRAAFWRDYGPLIGLLGVFTFYFLICRRLSLVFEWAFLAGPIGALPGGCWEWYLKPQTSLQLCFVLLLKLITFTCFYASGVFVLWLRY